MNYRVWNDPGGYEWAHEDCVKKAEKHRNFSARGRKTRRLPALLATGTCYYCHKEQA